MPFLSYNAEGMYSSYLALFVKCGYNRVKTAMILSLLEIMFLLWLAVGVIRAIAGILQVALGLAGVALVALWAIALAVFSLPLFFLRR